MTVYRNQRHACDHMQQKNDEARLPAHSLLSSFLDGCSPSHLLPASPQFSVWKTPEPTALLFRPLIASTPGWPFCLGWARGLAVLVFSLTLPGVLSFVLPDQGPSFVLLSRWFSFSADFAVARNTCHGSIYIKNSWAWLCSCRLVCCPSEAPAQLHATTPEESRLLQRPFLLRCCFSPLCFSAPVRCEDIFPVCIFAPGIWGGISLCPRAAFPGSREHTRGFLLPPCRLRFSSFFLADTVLSSVQWPGLCLALKTPLWRLVFFRRFLPLTLLRVKMARNAERANAVLNKWLAVKDAVVKGVATRERRPRDISSCNDLKQAEKW